jgi:hypothetical protein
MAAPITGKEFVMPSRCLAAVKCHAVVLLALGACLPAYAQNPPQPGGTAAIDNVIGDAVKEGESPYRPMPRPPGAAAPTQQTIDDAECQQLMAQMNETPKRSYKSGAPVENSQGNDVLSVERDRSRRQLQKTFKEKCGA